MKNNLMFFFIMSSFFMFMMNFHPFYLSMGLLSISLSMMGVLCFNFFHLVNYILGLVYLGGLLVLFVYVSSMVPFLKFKSSFKIMKLMIFFLFLFVFFFLKLDLILENYFSFEMNYIMFSSMKSYSIIFLLLVLFLLVLFLSGELLKNTKLPLRTI